MVRPYLIQRLNKPATGEGIWAKASEVFAFGGGLRNGGLTEEAMGLLRKIWSFDYMGSAEFEFGAVPKALHRLGQATDRCTFNFQAKTKERKAATIYAICREPHREEIKAWILAKAKDEWGNPDLRTKESVGIQGAINGDEFKRRIGGWLELDTGFLFFIDREMYEKAAELFEVKEPVAA